MFQMPRMIPFYIMSKSLLCVFFLPFLLLKVAKADTNLIHINTYCGNYSYYLQNSTYGKNLKSVLSDLVGQASKSSFYNSSKGITPDIVYGAFYCRADISRKLCKECVESTVQKLVDGCTNKYEKVAIDWYQVCTVRYSDIPLFSVVDDYPAWWIRHSQNLISNPEQLKQVMNITLDRIIRRAAFNFSNNGFQTEEASLPPYSTLYSLVQCSPDILGSSCERCLLGCYRDLQIIWNKKHERIWAMVFRPNCQLRYDTSPFYTKRTPLGPPGAQPPLPEKGIQFYVTRAVVPAAGFIILLLCIIIFYNCRRKKQQKISDGSESNVRHSYNADSLQYSLHMIQSATGSFSDDNKLGQGGFGAVYRGKLLNGQEVAVKRLSEDSRQGLREFRNEVKLVAKLQHKNLVILLGFCSEREEKLLVYEFVSNLSLDKFLFDSNRSHHLNWDTRFKIIIGIARGLLYLHVDSRVKIIHRDLKSSNILLDEEMNPKIADFGMARLMKIDHTQTHTTSKIFGTFGYMAPEYVATGVFSTKSDVYSFGVMLLEIVSGQSNNLFIRSCGQDSLICYAWRLWNTGTIHELLDPSLGNNYSMTEVLRCVQVGLLCVQEDPASRPTMETVVLVLGTSSDVQNLPSPLPLSHNTNTQGHNVARGTQEFENQNNDYTGRFTALSTDLYPR